LDCLRPVETISKKKKRGFSLIKERTWPIQELRQTLGHPYHMRHYRNNWFVWKRTVPGEDQFKCRSDLERGEGGSEDQSLVAVCGGCPMLQIGVTGNIDW